MKSILTLILVFIIQISFSQTFKKGDKVQILWESKWYNGKIEEVNGEKYLISYDGYDASWNETVGADRLKSASTNSTNTTSTTNTTNSTNTSDAAYLSYKSVETIWDMVPSPDGKYILAASAYGKLYILDAITLQELSMIKLTEGAPIFCAAWSHDGDYIATGYSDGNAIVYQRTEGLQFTEYDTLEGYASIAEVKFNPKKLELAVYGAPKKDYALGKLDIWDIQNKKIKLKLIDTEKWGMNVVDMQYSDDGSKFGICGAYELKGIFVYDSTGKEINKIKSEKEVACMDFSPDGGMIVSGGIDGKVTLWNLSNNTKVWSKEWKTGATEYLVDVAFAPNGLTIAACGRGGGYPIRIYNLASGSVKNDIGTSNPVGNNIFYSSDSKFVYIAFTTYGDIAKVPVVCRYKIPE